MFRSLQRSFEKKLSQFKKGNEKGTDVRRFISSFLENQRFSQDVINTIKIDYNNKTGVVTIYVPHKIIASEISMRSEDMRAHLKGEGVEIRRIIVS